MKDLGKIRKVAVCAAYKAGAYAIKNLGKIKEISHKNGHNNLVTNVDKKCEKMIVSMIKKHFPEHSILAEEGGELLLRDDFKWIIDPLDGTTNYAHALPIFCVSIAVAYKDDVKFGVVYDPARDEMFEAEEGKGAYLNGKKISVSKIDKIPDSLMVTGFAYDMDTRKKNLDFMRKMLEKAQAVRRLGAAAIDLCYVACGRFEGFWEFGLAPWDTAAGQLIVKEAGGKISTLDNGKFDIFQKQIVATNGMIHAEMIKLLNV